MNMSLLEWTKDVALRFWSTGKMIVMLTLTILPLHVVRGDTITMVFAESIPPYSFPEKDAGIELDIIRESLAYKGHKLEAKYFPLARIPTAFMADDVDASMTDLGEDMNAKGGHYGSPAVIYQNALISLDERSLIVEQPRDAEGMRVIAFQGAKVRYPEWAFYIMINGVLQESASQKIQVKMLLADRVDLVLSDVSIFKYYARKTIGDGVHTKNRFKVHDVFHEDVEDYRPVFKSETIRDDFNLGLESIKRSGRFEAIYDHYLNPENQ
jgi:polar amino acid transport system substrate-binding protein